MVAKRPVVLWLAVAAAALALLCGLGLVGLVWVSRTLGATPQWVEVTSAPAQFHVKAAAKRFHFREQGFQDPHYELLFEVPDVERFLSENGLTRGEAAAPATADAPVKAAAATQLEGFTDDALYRSGQLWHANGKTWVYLVAFGT